MNYQFVKHQSTSFRRQTGMMLPVAKILAQNVTGLIARLPERPPRPELAARMGIGDKTLGFIRAGTGNPTLDSVEKVARFLRVQPWELLRPETTETSSQSERLDDSIMAQGVDLLYLLADARPEDRRLKRPSWAMLQVAGKAVQQAKGDPREAMALILAELSKETW